MIILKIPVAHDYIGVKPFITEISSVLFNLEQGKNIFDSSGNFIKGELYGTNFNTIKKDGISYNIVGNTGNVILLNMNINVLNNFKNDLDKQLLELDKKFYKKNSTFCYRKFNSTDYFSSFYNLNSANTEHIKNKNFRKIEIMSMNTPINNTGYLWKLQRWDSVLFVENKMWKNRNMNEFEILQKHNTLIIDCGDIFNYTERIAFLTKEPEIQSYKMSEKFISMEKVFIVSNRQNPIKAELYNGIFTNRDYQYDYGTVCDIKYPIYHEEWENINPVRIKKKEEILSDVEIKRLLINFHKNKKNTTESEEIKNRKHGAPPTYTDICSICSMYLYDDIYVLEKQNRDFHICVCADCLHEHITVPDLNLDHAFNDITILRVKYPRTAAELIQHEDNTMCEYKKQLVTELLEGFTLKRNNKVVETSSFIGYSKDRIRDVLVKDITMYDEKKLFVFEFV